MTGVSIFVDLSQFRRTIGSVGRRQMPFASALALNDTGKDVGEAWADHMRTKLDRPTPFTVKGSYLRRATKTRLTAEVGLKPRQADYLRLQSTGGVRRPKGKALVVPAGVRLNKYGNMPRGKTKALLARSDVFSVSGSSRRASHLPPGIYQRRRSGQGVKLLVAFELSATYRSRLQLRRVAELKVATAFVSHFRRRFAAARLTAK